MAQPDFSIADKLAEARKLIEPRGAWIQSDYARIGGSPAHKISKAATCFCAVGALAAANGVEYPNSSMPGVRELSLAIGGDGEEADILCWNDVKSRKKREVIEAFKRAEQIARGEVA